MAAVLQDNNHGPGQPGVAAYRVSNFAAGARNVCLLPGRRACNDADTCRPSVSRALGEAAHKEFASSGERAKRCGGNRRQGRGSEVSEADAERQAQRGRRKEAGAKAASANRKASSSTAGIIWQVRAGRLWDQCPASPPLHHQARLHITARTAITVASSTKLARATIARRCASQHRMGLGQPASHVGRSSNHRLVTVSLRLHVLRDAP